MRCGSQGNSSVEPRKGVRDTYCAVRSARQALV